MIKEVADQLQILRSVHTSIDKMLAEVPDGKWVEKPTESINTIAATLEHVLLVERKFMEILSGQPSTIDAGAPFKASSWDVPAIKADWANVLQFSESVLANLTETQLDEYAMKLGIGEVNKRQLISYTIAHATHHRGQFPIMKKLLG